MSDATLVAPRISPTTECEIKNPDNGIWIKMKVQDILRQENELNKKLLKRCVLCHGRVRAHRGGTGGAHIEHFQRHSGCPRSDAYDGGGVILHPKALDPHNPVAGI